MFYFIGFRHNFIKGNILNAGTAGIAIICDSRFALNAGLGRAIKDAAGNDFLVNCSVS